MLVESHTTYVYYFIIIIMNLLFLFIIEIIVLINCAISLLEAIVTLKYICFVMHVCMYAACFILFIFLKGKVEFWDPRMKRRAGVLDCGLSCVAENTV